MPLILENKKTTTKKLWFLGNELTVFKTNGDYNGAAIRVHCRLFQTR